jgi:hypothetical protein
MPGSAPGPKGLALKQVLLAQIDRLVQQSAGGDLLAAIIV